MKNAFYSCLMVCLAGSALAAEPKPLPENYRWTAVPYADVTFREPRYELAFDLVSRDCNGQVLPRYAIGETNMLFFADHFAYRPKFKGCAMAFSAHATLDVPAEGDYAFEVNVLESRNFRNSTPVRLAVDGAFVDERPNATLHLRKGKAHVSVWVRPGNPEQAANREHGVAYFSFRWKRPGGSAFEAMPLTGADSAAIRATELKMDHRWTLEERLQQRFVCFHTYPLDIPEDGYYFIGWRGGKNLPAQRWALEDLEIYTGGNAGWMRTRYGYPWDTWGERHVNHLTFWGEQGTGRFFRKGSYRLSASTYVKHFDVDEHPGLMKEADFYWRRLDGKNPVSDTCFWLDTDCLVFRAGETLSVKAGRPGDLPGKYALEVTRQNGDGKVVFRQEQTVGAKPVSFDYGCPEEGAFEIFIRDEKGRAQYGPVEFAVVDVKGARQRARQEGAAAESVTNGCTLVDRWTVAEGAGGAHHFRDNGTSVVKETPAGRYVETGPLGTGEGRTPLMAVDPRKGLYRYLTDAEKEAYKTHKLRADQHLQQADWFAVTLKVKKLHKTHILRFRVPNDTLRGTAVVALDRKTGDKTATSFLSGCGEKLGPWSWGQIYLWPNVEEVDVMVANTMHLGVRKPNNRRGAVAEIEILETPDEGVPPLKEAAAGWTGDRDFFYVGEQMNIGVNEATTPERWRDDQYGWAKVTDTGLSARNFKDFLQSWNRWGENAAARGENLFLAPCCTYVMAAYAGYPSFMLAPARDPYVAGFPRESLDPVNRDVFALMLLVAEKYGVKMGADFMSNRIRPHVMNTWAAIQGRPAETNGIYLAIDAKGTPYTGFASPNAVNPAHPVIRKQLVDFTEAMSRRYGRYPAFCGIRHRFWTGCPSDFEPWFLCCPRRGKDGQWISPLRLGYDDFTVGAFAKAKGIPGLDPVGADQAKWEARRTLIETQHLAKWDEWRADVAFTLKEEMLKALKSHAPDARFYVTSDGDTPWKVEAGLDPKRFKGRRDLGYLEEQGNGNEPGVELGYVDGRCFKNFNLRPEPYGNPTNMGESYTMQFCYPSLPCCNASIKAYPYELEKPARMLAENRLLQLLCGPEWMLPSPDDGLREFVQVFRAIPALDYRRLSAATADDDAVIAAWQGAQGGETVIYAVNRTDMALEGTLTLDGRAMKVENLVTGEAGRFTKEIAFAIKPFMPAVWKVSGGHRAVGLAVRPGPVDRARIERRLAPFTAFAKEASPTLVGTNGLTYAAALKALVDVRDAGRWFELSRRLGTFADEERLHFDVAGWPKEVAFVPETPWPWDNPGAWRRTWGYDASMDRALGKHRLLSPPENGTVETLAPNPQWPRAKKGYLRVKEGVRYDYNFAGTSKPRRLYVHGWFGGDLGAIRVEQHGKNKDVVYGTLPRGRSEKPRLETRALEVLIPALPTSSFGTEVTLVPVGGDMLIDYLKLVEVK